MGIAGRITARREHGKLAFLTLKDGTGTLQLFVPRAALGDESNELFARMVQARINRSGRHVPHRRDALAGLAVPAKLIAAADDPGIFLHVETANRLRERLRDLAGLAPVADAAAEFLYEFFDADASAITRPLAEAGIYVAELTPVRADLESVFLELTSGETLDTGILSTTGALARFLSSHAEEQVARSRIEAVAPMFC